MRAVQGVAKELTGATTPRVSVRRKMRRRVADLRRTRKVRRRDFTFRKRAGKVFHGFPLAVKRGDASKTRKTRIFRRERTYAYVTEKKRKFDDVLRSIYAFYINRAVCHRTVSTPTSQTVKSIRAKSRARQDRCAPPRITFSLRTEVLLA